MTSKLASKLFLHHHFFKVVYRAIMFVLLFDRKLSTKKLLTPDLNCKHNKKKSVSHGKFNKQYTTNCGLMISSTNGNTQIQTDTANTGQLCQFHRSLGV